MSEPFYALASLSPSEWFVMLGGFALIGGINWYFFFSPKNDATAAPVADGETQEVSVVVHGGYDPQVVRVKAGQPLRITFDRRENSSCSEEVVLPDFNIRRFLPAHQKTTIAITPPKPGTYEFWCGMNMLRGTIVAE